MQLSNMLNLNKLEYVYTLSFCLEFIELDTVLIMCLLSPEPKQNILTKHYEFKNYFYRLCVDFHQANLWLD